MKQYKLYKPPKKNCSLCKGTGYILEEAIGHGTEHYKFYDKFRCSCTFNLTKKFKKINKKIKKLKAKKILGLLTKENKKELKKLKKIKFYDNNSQHNTELIQDRDF